MRRVVTGAGFRFAMAYTLAFMGCVAAIGVTAHLAVVTELEAQARRSVEAEASALVDEFTHGGRPDLDAALAGRTRAGDPIYRYAMLDGADIAGANPGDPKRAGITVSRGLGDGTYILVTDDLARVGAIRDTIDHAFLLALGAAALLGLGTGALLSGALLGRLDRVTRAADAVAAGNLDRRMPTTGSGDEFDRLAVTLNRMLDRIGDLMANLRQVSNDVAHDLRTPLSRLRQELEAAQRRATTIGEYEGAIGRALDDVDGILDIFAALLRIAQVESGSRRSGFRRVDLSALVAGVAETYKVVADEEGRRFATDVQGGISIDGDGELLSQMMINLVENAFQHTSAGSGIGVGVSAAGSGSAAIWVTDEGSGIPRSERTKVLRRFYRLDRSRSDERHGLGLSLVDAVTELHGGRLTLSDAKPGLRVVIELSNAGAPSPAKSR